MRRLAFEAGCDIDAVAEYVVALDDHVAEIDADAHLKGFGVGRLPSGTLITFWSSTPQRTASTTLPNSASRPSPIDLKTRPLLPNCRVNNLLPPFHQAR